MIQLISGQKWEFICSLIMVIFTLKPPPLFQFHQRYSVTDPGKEPGGLGLPFIFRPNWGPKNFFRDRTPPPLSQGLYDRRPPARPYLKFWIRHCYYSHVTFTQRPLLDHMPIQNLTGIKTFLFMEINRIMTERKKLVQLRSQLPLIEAD